jgi:gephyrin
MPKMELRFRGFYLTVSDRASRGEYPDESGPLIERFLKTMGASSVDSKIVPDEICEIQSTVESWTVQNSSMSVLITTGGTGFSSRDVTPEAISPLLTKNASGLVHLLLDAFVREDPLFSLSRLVAGISGQTFIVTLPGRPAAVVKGLSCLARVFPKLISDISVYFASNFTYSINNLR